MKNIQIFVKRFILTFAKCLQVLQRFIQMFTFFSTVLISSNIFVFYRYYVYKFWSMIKNIKGYIKQRLN